MKIFYCITFLHFGAGRALLDLAKEAVRRGHQATIAATRKIDNFESQSNLIEEAEVSGIPVILVDDIFTRDFRKVNESTVKIGEIFAKEQFDLIHSHAAIPAFAAALASKNTYGRLLPHVSTVHAWSPDKPSWMKLQDTFILNNVDAVHAVSHNVAEFLIQEGVKSELVKVIYNGCNFERIDQLCLREVAATAEEKKRRFRIGTVADLSDRKGINYLVDAVALLPEKFRDELEVIIVGEGPNKEALQQQAKNLGIEKIVHFMGYASNPFQYMVSFDLFVLPSLSEGLPVSLVESMYLGVPVLATDVQGNREILQGGRNGLVVPPRDSSSLARGIMEFYNNRKTYLAKARQGKMWVISHFSRNESFDRVFGLYNELRV